MSNTNMKLIAALTVPEMETLTGSSKRDKRDLLKTLIAEGRLQNCPLTPSNSNSNELARQVVQLDVQNVNSPTTGQKEKTMSIDIKQLPAATLAALVEQYGEHWMHVKGDHKQPKLAGRALEARVEKGYRLVAEAAVEAEKHAASLRQHVAQMFGERINEVRGRFLQKYGEGLRYIPTEEIVSILGEPELYNGLHTFRDEILEGRRLVESDPEGEIQDLLDRGEELTTRTINSRLVQLQLNRCGLEVWDYVKKHCIDYTIPTDQTAEIQGLIRSASSLEVLDQMLVDFQTEVEQKLQAEATEVSRQLFDALRQKAHLKLQAWGDEFGIVVDGERARLDGLSSEEELNSFMDDQYSRFGQLHQQRQSKPPVAVQPIGDHTGAPELASMKGKDVKKHLRPHDKVVRETFYGLAAEELKGGSIPKPLLILCERVGRGETTPNNELNKWIAFLGREEFNKLMAEAIDTVQQSEPEVEETHGNNGDDKVDPITQEEQDSSDDNTDDESEEEDAAMVDVNDNQPNEGNNPESKKDSKKEGAMKRFKNWLTSRYNNVTESLRDFDATWGLKPLKGEDTKGYKELLADTIGLIEGMEKEDTNLVPEVCTHTVKKDGKEVTELRPAADLLETIVKNVQASLKGVNEASKRAMLAEDGKIRETLRKGLEDMTPPGVLAMNMLFAAHLVRTGNNTIVDMEDVEFFLLEDTARFYGENIEHLIETGVINEEMVQKLEEVGDSIPEDSIEVREDGRPTNEVAKVGLYGGTLGETKVQGLIPFLKEHKLLEAVEKNPAEVERLTERQQKEVRKLAKDPVAAVERIERINRRAAKCKDEAAKKEYLHRHRNVLTAFAFLGEESLISNPMLDNQEILIEALRSTKIKDSDGEARRLPGMAKPYGYDLSRMIVEVITEAGDNLEGQHRRVLYTILGSSELKKVKVDGGSWVRYYSYTAVREVALFGVRLVSWVALPIRFLGELTVGIVYDLFNKGERTMKDIAKARWNEAWNHLKSFGWHRPKAFFTKIGSTVKGWFSKDESKEEKSEKKGVFGRLSQWASTAVDKAKEHASTVVGTVAGVLIGWGAVHFMGLTGWFAVGVGIGCAVVGGVIGYMLRKKDEVKTESKEEATKDAGTNAGTDTPVEGGEEVLSPATA